MPILQLTSIMVYLASSPVRNLRHDTVKNAMHHWAKNDSQQRADNVITTPSGEMYLCNVWSACLPLSQRLGSSKAAAAEKHSQPDAKAQRAVLGPRLALRFLHCTESNARALPS